MQARLSEELSLLRRYFGEIDFVDPSSWIRVAKYRLGGLWEPSEVSVAYQVPAGFPGMPPYGFYVQQTPRLNGAPLQGSAPPNKPPFAGDWLHISWAAETWLPAASAEAGSNLWGWTRSFADRFREGP